MAAAVLCIGIAVHDFVFGMAAIPDKPQKYRAKALAQVGGGCAATAAVAVAKLGGSVVLGIRLGDDMLAETILRELEGYGVACTLAQRFAGRRSSLSAVFVDDAGERMIVNYRDHDMPDGTGWIPDPLPAGTRVVLADNRWPNGATAAFERARRAGIPGVLDAETPLDGSDAAIRTASHAAFSADAIAEYVPDTPIADAVGKVARDTGGFVCATDGPRGLWYSSPEGVRHMPAFAVDVVDTLGAGDTWHGAFALALAEGQSEVAAMRFASAAAALKCTRFGGRAGVPGRAEVEAFLKERA